MPTSAKRPRHAWMLLSLFPLGLGAWVPLVAGLRARRPLWVALGILYCAVLLAGFIIGEATPDEEDGSLAGMLIVLPWAAAAATTLAIYPSYRRRRALLEDVEEREHGSERLRLQTLPGVDADLARRIVATRESVGQFDSVADMAFVLDLDPDTAARLERVAIAIDA